MISIRRAWYLATEPLSRATLAGLTGLLTRISSRMGLPGAVLTSDTFWYLENVVNYELGITDQARVSHLLVGDLNWHNVGRMVPVGAGLGANLHSHSQRKNGVWCPPGGFPSRPASDRSRSQSPSKPPPPAGMSRYPTPTSAWRVRERCRSHSPRPQRRTRSTSPRPQYTSAGGVSKEQPHSLRVSWYFPGEE